MRRIPSIYPRERDESVEQLKKNIPLDLLPKACFCSLYCTRGRQWARHCVFQSCSDVRCSSPRSERHRDVCAMHGAMSNAGCSSKASISHIHSLRNPIKHVLCTRSSSISFSPHVVIRRSSRLIELALLVLVRVRVLRAGISLATLLAANRMIWIPIAAVLSMLTGPRLRPMSIIVGRISLLVIIHEAIMVLYWSQRWQRRCLRLRASY